ncbi:MULTISPECIES: isoprenyl transferase [unclassified Gilliamella]|uniref:isoprenyl transferase n=1 Tax=unclassified Gilliamella TaxID=2685620 RepID=UPI002269CBD3|nr:MULTISPECIES: isoprenyl transferase [unclassified Gilliamella]MCX8600316.1 isoprenyl transferase [Gilliamella sp. B3722]MCX8609312.1 isoprenyl transferase [Gilliamella sp. B3771]MCX8609531.1 isoprenyl transferase [Gilliamella sp. B3891]MCX8612380.1 isoprenyl transferase [Gilliamella sp. B3773]MCX8615800.1 isoprenyl transferase [Gilliamella sp. B3770]
MTKERCIPSHVAIIMDGNGRWAQQRNQLRTIGHRAGLKAVRKIVMYAASINIKVLTLYAFSSENWKRPEKEVSALLALFIYALNREIKKLNSHNVRLNIIGDISRFNDELQNMIIKAQQLTKDNSGLVLNIAANYGGRWDILQSAKKMATQVVEGKISVDDITEDHFNSAMSMSEFPDVDLVIRTGGEYRISNFLLWQIAYSEFYFTDVLWPDFSQTLFDEAINKFNNRERRFGGVRNEDHTC